MLEDGVDELLLLHGAEVLDPHGFGHLGEFGYGGCLEVADINWRRWGRLVLGGALGWLPAVAGAVLCALVVSVVLAFVASGEGVLLPLARLLVLGFSGWLGLGLGFLSGFPADGFAAWSFRFSGNGFGFDQGC